MNESNMKSVSISPGNQKMGAIPSVSLPPVVTCPKGVPCSKDCYAARYCKMRPSVRAAYETNLEILNENPLQYWLEVCRAAQLTRYFRFHVAGDIPFYGYLYGMKKVAERNERTEFLCFTKRYQWVNKFVERHGALPKNLHIIFSEWPGVEYENPFSFPTCRVLFPGDEPAAGEKLCGGNCSNCAIHDGGCWSLQPGETICIKKH